MKFSHIIIILSCIAISGCKDFLTIDPPKNRQVPGSVFNTNETANSAILGIMSQMSNGVDVTGYSLSFYTGISGDELVDHSNATDIYINALDSKVSATNGVWSGAYKLIYAANAIYYNVDKSTALPANLKKQLKAEALFIRAYWHFYLVNLFGDIPIVTDIDYTKNTSLTRELTAKVYEQIISDLKFAQENLNDAYLGSNGLSASSERIRPNKAVATALLARVYLYIANYKDAEVQSTVLIDDKAHYILEPLEKVFLKESKEAIWQIMPVSNNFFNTQEGLNYIPSESSIAEGRPTISDQLLSAFENGDNRTTEWLGHYKESALAGEVYYPFKYKVQTTKDFIEYSVPFRLAEQYLIRAEARAQQSKLLDAIADLDIIRDRAGLPLIKDTNPGIGKNNLLEAILKERRVELFTEYGQRWLDLKRTATINAVMTSSTALKGGVWSAYKAYFPIPYIELLNAPNIKQNQGYN